MELRNVLVVAKKSSLERYTRERPDPKFAKLLADRDPLVEKSIIGHEKTQHAIRTVVDGLTRRGIPHRVVHSTTKRAAAEFDFVISVGGDGTLLDASHGVGEQPILAVNSYPERSVGYFCGARADDFEERFERILDGQAEPTPLNRIAIELGDRLLPHAALNDVLFAHVNPAATSRYLIGVGEEEEEHMSSGVWISTAAGSTAAIRAAGGVRQPIRSTDLQYLVRELYRPPKSALHLTGGILSEPLVIVSKTYEAAVFLDGHRLRYRVGYGDRLRVRAYERPLRLYMFEKR